MVLFMDVMVAMLLSCHLGFMFKLPVMGAKMRELVVDGKYILSKQPWMQKLTYVGIVAFVMFPLAATGSVGGSIFGRLLGLSRLSTFMCVLVGSVMGCGSMYLLGDALKPLMKSTSAKIGGIAVIIAFIFMLNHRYQKMKSMHLASLEEQANSDDSNNAGDTERDRGNAAARSVESDPA